MEYMAVKSIVKRHSVLFWVTLAWSLTELVMFIVYKWAFFYGGYEWMGIYYTMGML